MYFVLFFFQEKIILMAKNKTIKVKKNEFLVLPICNVRGVVKIRIFFLCFFFYYLINLFIYLLFLNIIKSRPMTKLTRYIAHFYCNEFCIINIVSKSNFNFSEFGWVGWRNRNIITGFNNSVKPSLPECKPVWGWGACAGEWVGVVRRQRRHI